MVTVMVDDDGENGLFQQEFEDIDEAKDFIWQCVAGGVDAWIEQ